MVQPVEVTGEQLELLQAVEAVEGREEVAQVLVHIQVHLEQLRYGVLRFAIVCWFLWTLGGLTLVVSGHILTYSCSCS